MVFASFEFDNQLWYDIGGDILTEDIDEFEDEQFINFQYAIDNEIITDVSMADYLKIVKYYIKRTLKDIYLIFYIYVMYKI